jgi:hypothetical protein
MPKKFDERSPPENLKKRIVLYLDPSDMRIKRSPTRKKSLTSPHKKSPHKKSPHKKSPHKKSPRRS